ncbi:condensation domain-containing protein [Streptomyces sp. NPDC059568]|uniref:condensation domain-containing protein n=1 Tax=Streptomyces sp. NPDC059568 TaxID=3346868 RepID=UPI0036806610
MNHHEELPLAPSQEMLWEFMTALAPHDPGGARLVVVDCRMLYGKLNPAAFRRALDDVVQRHEALRMTFTRVAHDPSVRIRPRMAAPLRMVNLSGRPETEQRHHTDSLVLQERNRRFDLENGPLWHINLIRLGPDRHLLILCFFHLISDGWSCQVFVRDLMDAYRAHQDGIRPTAGPAPTFHDISEMQRARITGRPDRLAYWRRELLPPTHYQRFPARDPAPDTDLTKEVYLPFTFRAETAEGLRRLAWRCRTTPYIAVVAAFHILLALRTGAERVTIGTTTLGRDTPRSRLAIGQFTNNVYVPAWVRPDDSLAEVVRGVHRAMTGATENVSSYKSLAGAVNPDFAARRPWPDNHLFDAWLQSAAPDSAELEMSGLRVEQLFIEGKSAAAAPALRAADVPAAQLPVWVKRGSPIVVVDDDRRGGGMIYNSHLFDAGFAAGLVADLLSITEALTRDPGSTVAGIAARHTAGRPPLIAN